MSNPDREGLYALLFPDAVLLQKLFACVSKITPEVVVDVSITQGRALIVCNTAIRSAYMRVEFDKEYFGDFPSGGRDIQLGINLPTICLHVLKGCDGPVLVQWPQDPDTLRWTTLSNLIAQPQEPEKESETIDEPVRIPAAAFGSSAFGAIARGPPQGTATATNKNNKRVRKDVDSLHLGDNAKCESIETSLMDLHQDFHLGHVDMSVLDDRLLAIVNTEAVVLLKATQTAMRGAKEGNLCWLVLQSDGSFHMVVAYAASDKINTCKKRIPIATVSLEPKHIFHDNNKTPSVIFACLLPMATVDIIGSACGVFDTVTCRFFRIGDRATEGGDGILMHVTLGLVDGDTQEESKHITSTIMGPCDLSECVKADGTFFLPPALAQLFHRTQ